MSFTIVSHCQLACFCFTLNFSGHFPDNLFSDQCRHSQYLQPHCNSNGKYWQGIQMGQSRIRHSILLLGTNATAQHNVLTFLRAVSSLVVSPPISIVIPRTFTRNAPPSAQNEKRPRNRVPYKPTAVRRHPSAPASRSVHSQNHHSLFQWTCLERLRPWEDPNRG